MADPIATSRVLHPAVTALQQQLLAALPQTQCQRCGYPDCAAYAQAMALGEADIDQCPPGGAQGVVQLAALTRQNAKPLNPQYGSQDLRHVALIDEDWCIGCTLCLKACPVDAIVGANKLMHSVMETCCTGCELCLPVCPVDCITLEPVGSWAAWSAADAEQAKNRYAQRQARLGQTPVKISHPNADNPAAPQSGTAINPKNAIIEAALARARSQRKTTPHI